MPIVPWSRTVFAQNEVTFAQGRVPDRTYVSKTFPLQVEASRDHGQPTRFVNKVFDESDETEDTRDDEGIEWTEHVVDTTPKGRKQIRLMVCREAGAVREILLTRVPGDPSATKMEQLLRLDRDASARLIELVRSLDYIPVNGGEETVRVDDELLREVFSDPSAAQRLYNRDPATFKELIEADPSTGELVAIAHRREVVAEFRRLMNDADYVEDRRTAWGVKQAGLEPVWQRFFERNPWLLGVTLSGQLLTSWSDEKLEQVVAGFSVGHDGKRADALLRTSGEIRSLVFAEIKHPNTDLLEEKKEYRSGCWAPSWELAGGVTQVQQTVALAARDLNGKLPDTEPDGSLSGTMTYLVRPRSYLVVGHLDKLKGPTGGVHESKFQSFELYRRNLYEPEIVTFDELLARAEWLVEVAAAEKTAPDNPAPADEPPW